MHSRIFIVFYYLLYLSYKLLIYNNMNTPITTDFAISLIEGYAKETNQIPSREKTGYRFHEADDINYGFEFDNNGDITFYGWGITEEHSFTKFINSKNIGLDLF